MFFYKFHVGDYRRDAAHLTLCEQGAYRSLLDQYYLNEAPLPDDIKKICRLIMAKSKKEKKIVEDILNEFFTQSSGGWRHKRCDKELAGYSAAAEVSRLNGALGGRPKKTQRVILKNPGDVKTEPKATLTTNHEPLTTNQKNIEQCPEGVDLSVWVDWLTIRGTATNVTKTTIYGIEQQAVKAGITLQKAFEICCQRGWKSFDADWIKLKSESPRVVRGSFDRESATKENEILAKEIAFGESTQQHSELDVTEFSKLVLSIGAKQ